MTTVVSHQFPYLPVSVNLSTVSHSGDALLDTGFDGDVVVPASFVSASASPDWYVNCMLADGSLVLAPAYAGTLRIDSLDAGEINALVLGHELLVGRGVIGRFTVTLDHGQRVTAEA